MRAIDLGASGTTKEPDEAKDPAGTVELVESSNVRSKSTQREDSC